MYPPPVTGGGCRFPPALLAAGQFCLTMAYESKIGVEIVNLRFPRYAIYVIVDNRRQYWTGTDWTKDVHKVLVYANPGIMWPDVLALREKHYG
jgi:hypothetical protein